MPSGKIRLQVEVEEDLGTEHQLREQSTHSGRQNKRYECRNGYIG
jgi:hypothetical protein